MRPVLGGHDAGTPLDSSPNTGHGKDRPRARTRRKLRAMQPTEHTFEISYHDAPRDEVQAANVSEVGDWMTFTDFSAQMVFMAQKIAVKSIRRIGPVEPVEDVAA